jgi:hypothetical protein
MAYLYINKLSCKLGPVFSFRQQSLKFAPLFPLLLNKIIRINLLDLIGSDRRNAHIVFNHEFG